MYMRAIKRGNWEFQISDHFGQILIIAHNNIQGVSSVKCFLSDVKAALFIESLCASIE